MRRHLARGLGGLAVWAVFMGSTPAAVADEECLGCHAPDAEVVEEPFQVEPDAWAASVHAQMGFGCTDCHTDKEDYPHEESEVVLCATCHDDIASDVAVSVHGDECCGNGDVRSPFPSNNTCLACHGSHDVLAVDDPESRSYFRNVPSTCAVCHADLHIVQEQGLRKASVDNYQHSVHGLRLDDPDKKPAVCTDCHGTHRIVRARHPESKINPFNIATTCGACHGQESEDYRSSVHGTAFQRGIAAAPNCTNCHGIHSIQMVPAEGASPREAHLVRTTCPTCHASEALMNEYGVPVQRVNTYEASYHGLANRRGNTAVADCASCHGVHAIYPSTDPRSTIAPVNLQKTCGHCHPGASDQFAKSPVHFTTEGEATIDVVITAWVKKIYWALLLIVLGGMLVHNAVIMSYYVRRKLKEERESLGRLRFSRRQVIQHAALVISFTVLVVSGFMLAYPDTWWSRLLVDAGVTESIRRWVHRGAAIVMVGASFYHLGWILGTPYGRAELRRIAPTLRDMREFLQNMRFHLGRSNLPAAFGKYDYPAKAEYWALVWGTVVMALTGLVLWFPVVTTSLLPFWVVKVSEVIHLFEAWLATLAIVIFHFFYVIGHPEVYPISLGMFHGRMPRDQARHHHPRWHENGTDVSEMTAGAVDPRDGKGSAAEDTRSLEHVHGESA